MEQVIRDRSKAHCNKCGHSTNHDLRCEFEYTEGGLPTFLPSEQEEMSMMSSDQVDAYKWNHYVLEMQHTHQIVQCKGCESVSYRHISVYCERGQDPYAQQYPPPVARHRPRWLSDLQDSNLAELLQEIYSALQADNRRLATMGSRCAVDVLMTEVVGDVGGFQEKMEAMQSDGHISKVELQILAAVIGEGDAAMHRNYCPTPLSLSRVLDIIEHLVEKFRILPLAAEAVRETTPPRPPRTRRRKPKRSGSEGH